MQFNEVKLNLGKSLEDWRGTLALHEQLRNSKFQREQAIYNFNLSKAAQELQSIEKNISNIDYVTKTDEETINKQKERADYLSQNFNLPYLSSVNSYMFDAMYKELQTVLDNINKCNGNKKLADSFITSFKTKWQPVVNKYLNNEFIKNQRDLKVDYITNNDIDLINMTDKKNNVDNGLNEANNFLNNKPEEIIKTQQEIIDKNNDKLKDVNLTEEEKIRLNKENETAQNNINYANSQINTYKTNKDIFESSQSVMEKDINSMSKIYQLTSPIDFDMYLDNLFNNTISYNQQLAIDKINMQGGVGSILSDSFNKMKRSDIDTFLSLSPEMQSLRLISMVDTFPLPDNVKEEIKQNPKQWLSYLDRGKGYTESYLNEDAIQKNKIAFNKQTISEMINFVNMMPVSYKSNTDEILDNVLGMAVQMLNINEIKDIDDDFIDSFIRYTKQLLKEKKGIAEDNEAIRKAQFELDKVKVLSNVNYQKEDLNLKKEANDINRAKLYFDGEKWNYEKINKDKPKETGKSVIGKKYSYINGEIKLSDGSKTLFTEPQAKNILNACGAFGDNDKTQLVLDFIADPNRTIDALRNGVSTNKAKAELLPLLRHVYDENKKFYSLINNTIESLKTDGLKVCDEVNIYEYILSKTELSKGNAAWLSMKINNKLTTEDKIEIVNIGKNL